MMANLKKLLVMGADDFVASGQRQTASTVIDCHRSPSCVAMPQLFVLLPWGMRILLIIIRLYTEEYEDRTSLWRMIG